MKRQIIIISIFLIIIAMAYGFIYSNEITKFGLNEIIVESFDETESPYHISKENESDLNFFINLINNSEKSVTDNPNIQPSHQIQYKTNTKVLTYLVKVDVLNESVSIYDAENKYTYAISQSVSSDLMIHPAFSSSYLYNKPPELVIDGGQKIISISEYHFDWHYQKIDNNWYQPTISEISIENIEPVVISKPGQNIEFNFEVEPEILNLQIFDSKELVYERPLLERNIEPYIEDGLKTYKIEAIWPESDDYKFHGTATYSFDVLTDLPASLDFEETSVKIGGFFKINVNNLNPDEKPYLNQKILGSFQFYNADGITVGYLPASYHTKAGKYPLEFWTESKDGTKSKSINYSLDVGNRDFKIQHLTISTSTVKATRNDEAYSQFAKYFNPARESSVAEKLWDGSFIKPVEGRTSTTYGERRYVNNAPTSYRHSGMDIAAPRGTPIKATNSGKVSLAMNLILTGNTIVIDHGLGIFSVYFHCDSLNVDEGQMVKKADIIAEVGSTGFSTGPHLHWTMSIFDQNIDPEWIIDNDL